ncbi:hypothetical protein JZ751_013728 [Albula glossodonta]|uniref:FERM domain-containing protein n=1 Tax=Albula glossodonta TaxID=121402 RepID=A0A8T2NTM1_9TELE|nr:hypothetical protein JZ751_013728 [Albula glossodonta]
MISSEAAVVSPVSMRAADCGSWSVMPCLQQSKADGQALLTEVFQRFNLIESDYFGLEFQNTQMSWLIGGQTLAA